MELKPCICAGNGGDINIHMVVIRPQGFTRIFCNFCEEGVRGENLSETIEAWNRRTEAG